MMKFWRCDSCGRTYFDDEARIPADRRCIWCKRELKPGFKAANDLARELRNKQKVVPEWVISLEAKLILPCKMWGGKHEE